MESPSVFAEMLGLLEWTFSVWMPALFVVGSTRYAAEITKDENIKIASIIIKLLAIAMIIMKLVSILNEFGFNYRDDSLIGTMIKYSFGAIWSLAIWMTGNFADKLARLK